MIRLLRKLFILLIGISQVYRILKLDTLDMEEIFTMFKKNGYPINMVLLRKFFNATDKDHNSKKVLYNRIH